MSPRPIPSCVLTERPAVPAEAWQWVSPLRLRAMPEPEKVVIAVIDAEGELAKSSTLVEASGPSWAPRLRAHGHDERAQWVQLRRALMESLGRKIACQDGTPVTEVEDLCGATRRTTCLWCGRAADDHKIVNSAPARPIPPSVLAKLPRIPAEAWRWASSVRLRAPAGDRRRVAVAVIDNQGEHCFGYASVDRQDERAAAARLRTNLTKMLARKIACQDGTPQLHEDFTSHPTVVPASVRGTCVWCGRTPDEHETPAPEGGLAR